MLLTPSITDDRLQSAYEYWFRKRAGRIMPRRSDIDPPTDIPKLLPHIMLVDVLASGRYRYRLIGTEVVHEQGINATGCYVDDVIPGPDYKTHTLALYDACVRERRALYSESLLLSPSLDLTERHTKVIFMPLSADGEKVNMIFVVRVFLYMSSYETRHKHFPIPRPFHEIEHIFL
jgi:hypothetical protein